MERDHVALARRPSGGGAVFHDLGNLNFSFFLPRGEYDVQRQLRVVLSAVRAFGVEAEMTGRNDLTAGGRKFSGNAFRFVHDRALHHGTLLVRADMARGEKYLSVSPEKLKSKGVASVRARVVNLAELAGVSVAHLAEALAEEQGLTVTDVALIENSCAGILTVELRYRETALSVSLELK